MFVRVYEGVERRIPHNGIVLLFPNGRCSGILATVSGRGEMVDAIGLGPIVQKAWGFESLRPHKLSFTFKE